MFHQHVKRPLAYTVRPLIPICAADELKVTDLPFVKNRKGRRCFWHVSPTGRYAEDCIIGNYYALEAVAYMRAKGFPPLLGWIARDMPRADDYTGVEVGFMHAISELIG